MAMIRIALVLLLFSLAARADEAPVPPVPRDLPEIAFPDTAPADVTAADVEVRLVVDEAGRVREVVLVRGAGEPFDAAVLAGARNFTFAPATLAGRPVEVAVPYVHHFVRPAAPAATGPAYDAAISGIVQERGTRRFPSGLEVVAKRGGETFTATTDAEGRFRLALPAGEVELRITDGEHRPFLQREQLKSGEELKVRYLVDRLAFGGYESTVYGARERTEVSRTTLSGAELTKVAGTFGDPFRVVTVLPGVTTLMSLLPYPVVRGSSPGNTGEFLDGVRLPMLYHLLAGPSVVHPEFIDRIDFYPGGFPVSYGGYTGGIVDGITRKSSSEPRTELNLGLTNSGVFLRREVAGVTATVAGRYGYPGLLLSAVAPVSLSYWDYQARLDAKALGGSWTLLAYGARDEFDSNANTGSLQKIERVLALELHHLDLRYRRGDDDRNLTARVILSQDDSGTTPGNDARSRSIVPQLRFQARPWQALTVSGGLDATVRSVTSKRTQAQNAVIGAMAGALAPDGVSTSGGAFLQAAWAPFDGLLVVPGARVDVGHDVSATQGSVDPRLLVRWRVRENEGEAGETWLKAVAGVYHQPPRLALPVPGADEAKLSYGLLASKQASVGAEVKLARAVDLDVQGYFNANDPVLFDLSTNFGLGDLQNAPPTTGPAERPPVSNVGDQPDEVVSRMLQPLKGRAYGLEVLLRRRDARGFHGWIAYTLSRSEREKDGAWVPFDYDRRHILNAVAGLPLPRNWELGARVLFQTGTPLTTIHGYNTGRSDPQLRIDVRLDKRAVWNEWLLDFYVDVANGTVSPESGGLVGPRPFRYVLPQLGVRAVL